MDGPHNLDLREQLIVLSHYTRCCSTCPAFHWPTLIHIYEDTIVCSLDLTRFKSHFRWCHPSGHTAAHFIYCRPNGLRPPTLTPNILKANMFANKNHAHYGYMCTTFAHTHTHTHNPTPKCHMNIYNSTARRATSEARCLHTYIAHLAFYCCLIH